MSVDEDKLRAALEMLHKGELQDVAYDRGADPTVNRRADLIDELMDDNWNEKEFSELVDLVELLEKEDRAKGHYISEIEAISSVHDQAPKEAILSKLKNEQVEFNDEETDIEKPGFEITDTEGECIKGTYWTKTEDYILNPLGELRPTSTLYGTGYRIDLDEQRIYIQASLYGKAQGLRSIFEEIGISLQPVGFQELANDAANQRMETFVEDFEEKLDEFDEQSQLGDHK